jgi:hypothetical protein
MIIDVQRELNGAGIEAVSDYFPRHCDLQWFSYLVYVSR